jgi:two-component system cell cycle sensor histidine kinase/response regulator CckA
MNEKTKILIVDDDPNLRKTLANIFNAKGYLPLDVATGREALETVEGEMPPVALIDIRLEDISGLDVMKGIKKFSPDTECILITGHASQATAIEAIHLGAYSYILKPYDIDQLLLTVQRAIEKTKLEEQLRQAQKMEAVGTLAGGVAHDFNNILTTIIGNAHLALMDIGKDSPLREEIEEIKAAGERAAALTRQLLAFSRKQIAQPKILDLNELLAGLEKMLFRLIGENVEILIIPKPALWPVKIDPGQVEQVVMNLVINARDALPNGGKITVETANANLDENYFRVHGIDALPGSYVKLVVSDNGIGIDKETQEKIFDPFFTTKERGKGTGLGLSTAYGIVKQNNGFIWVYSEPGQGSTFKVYLPWVKGDVETQEIDQTSVGDIGSTEAVLVVEDDDALRKLVCKTLQQQGCKTLEAENGEDALKTCEEYEGPIQLIITDVVMPKMGGKEVVERLHLRYPQMKVIYMSGYTDNGIVFNNVLGSGINFIEKPFTPAVLAQKVREALD